MKTIATIEDELKRQITDTLVPLQTFQGVDVDGLGALVRLATEAAEELCGRHDLPRSLLNEIYVTVQILRAEAKYHHGPELERAANDLENVFALILRGEVPGDRKPGVPRTV